jgi:hypothetical protein
MSDEQVVDKPSEELAVPEKVTPRPGKTQIVYRKNGMFTKPPTPEEQLTTEQVRTAALNHITKPLDESGTTHFTEILDNHVAIAKSFDPKRGLAPQKSAELIMKVTRLLDKPEEQPAPGYTINFYPMDNMLHPEVEEYERRAKLKPSQPDFGNGKELPYIDAEIVTDEPKAPRGKMRSDGENIVERREDGTLLSEPKLYKDNQ